MRTVLRASLRHHTRRFVAAALAVVIGVAFIVTTSALSSAARNGMVSGIDAPYRNADVVISEVEGHEAGDLLDQAERDGARAAVLGWIRVQVSVNGRHLGDADAADVGAVADEVDLRWQQLEDGRFPEADDEVAVDNLAAKSNDIAVGDVLTIGRGADQHTATVVGTLASPSAMVWSTVYVTEHRFRAWLDQAFVTGVVWAGTGSTAKQLTSLRAAHPDAVVLSVDEHVDQELSRATQGVDMIAIMLLIFVAIALLTSAMVIANTFSILFAQRSRDFALLRCVGATRRQVLRSIRVEAFALGLAASGVGLVVGTGIGHAVVALIRQLAPGARLGVAEPSLPWYVGAFATGVVLTFAAAWFPTRRAVRVSPLAALRPDTGIDARSTAGRLQLTLGVLLVAGGVAALAGAVVATDVVLMVLGGAATSVGVVVLGPTIVPALIRAIAPLTGQLFGPAGRVATGNAVRNPRRTAATTAALLVGVTLTTAVLTGLASTRSTLDDEMNLDHPIDVAITATEGTGLDKAVVTATAALPEVERSAALPGVVAQIAGIGEVRVVAPTEEARSVLRDEGLFATPSNREIHLPYSVLVDDVVPRRVEVDVDGVRRTLRVATGSDWGEAGVVSSATLSALGAEVSTQAVWLRTDLGADADDLEAQIGALAQGADVASALQERAFVDLQIDVLTGAVLGLLGIAIVIALIGIGNTLGLSVLERARENALLRALGLTRGQLRSTLAIEAMLLALVATAIGTVLGVSFAWVGVNAMLADLVEEAPLTVPLGQLVLVTMVSAVAGLLASVLPTRRAARISPAAGLSLP